MINSLISFSLRNRLMVVLSALLLCAYGLYSLRTIPVDVFPNLNRPIVTVFAEAHSLAPEEVESLITVPLEAALNGATNVYRVRSNSSLGLAMLWVEFDWSSDIAVARQTVTERLQQVLPSLPPDTQATLGPVSSIMGEIMLIALSSDDADYSPIELRTLADWTLRPRLLALPGVSQVAVIGGRVKQHHLLVDRESLYTHNITLDEIVEALGASNQNSTGGILQRAYDEVVVRTLGRVNDAASLLNVPLPVQSDGPPLRIAQVARLVEQGPLAPRGDAAVNAAPAVILTIQKQPHADTLELTERIDRELSVLRGALPSGVTLHDDIFRQSKFIRASMENVRHALRDGALLVFVVLFLFLLNVRTTLITLTAIPTSIIVTILTFKFFGLSINTMTLGGLAIAIGELVDDAIVDVENVFRRLRENKLRPDPRPPIEVIYEASTEIRNSIVFATIVIVLAFVPLFALSGIEGRIFSPLGVAYITSILASLLVALTLTPALCYYLLPSLSQVKSGKENSGVIALKQRYGAALSRLLDRPRTALIITALAALGTLPLIITFGREFLPAFNEGSLTITLDSPPGTALEESNRVGLQAERLLLTVPEIKLTARRIGRAELDEHAEGVQHNEIDVELQQSAREHETVVAEVRRKLEDIPGVVLNIGQPISHRLDHILSGVQAQIAVKLYGPNLDVLRATAKQVQDVMQRVHGIVDLQIERQTLIPQLHYRVDYEAAARFGVSPAAITTAVETAMQGHAATEILLGGNQRSDVIVRLDDEDRSPDRVGLLPVRSSSGDLIPLSNLVNVEAAKGPNAIVRENASRRITVMANVAERDLVSTVNDVQAALRREIALPNGYFFAFEGQFQSQASASKLIAILGFLSLTAIFGVLYAHFKSLRIAGQIMLSVPFAIPGALIAIALSGGVLSVASLVGLITLAGIASRNGIMLIDHYRSLQRSAGGVLTLEIIHRGARERLLPVLMTALTAMLALLPIILTPAQPGREILYPVAVVIFGGLVSGTLLNLFVTPVVYWLSERGRIRES